MVAFKNGKRFPRMSIAIILQVLAWQFAVGSGKIIPVEIGVQNHMNPNGSASGMMFTGPPFEAACEYNNLRYAGIFNFSFTPLMRTDVVDCPTQTDAMPWMFAEWLFNDRTPDRVPVVVALGCVDTSTALAVHQIAASLGKLSIQVYVDVACLGGSMRSFSSRTQCHYSITSFFPGLILKDSKLKAT